MATTPTRAAALATTLALLAGCASDGGLRPSATLQDGGTLSASATLADVAVTPAAWPTHDWWQRYGDAQLNQLAAEALAGSPTMRVAAARVRQAAAVEGLAESALSPQLNGGARSNRQRFSEHSNVPKPLAGSWNWSNEASLNFSYELDFWGKNQAAVDAALGRHRAAEVDAEAARLVLMVALTQSYLKLSQLHAQRELAVSVLRQREEVLALHGPLQLRLAGPAAAATISGTCVCGSSMPMPPMARNSAACVSAIQPRRRPSEPKL